MTEPRIKQRSMTVAGIMSGTSADGIDVAIVRITAPTESAAPPKLKLLAHHGIRFPRALRSAVLAAMNANSISTAELARLSWRLGIAYSEAVAETLKKHPTPLHLIGCHGQTLYHQPQPVSYAGRRFACTWQAGEAQVLASMLGVPVVSNFRPADMLAGGQGAPLVPLLDYTLFAHSRRARVLQNIGGIANLTAIPASGAPSSVVAFDTGPGNMLIDALALELLTKPYDRNGAAAARGSVILPVLASALRNPYFRRTPPRTAGREQFGREYAAKFLSECRRHSTKPEDALATATALTAETIVQSYRDFVHPAITQNKPQGIDYIVSGGGAHNATLMATLRSQLEPLGCKVDSSSAFGIPAEAKEAAAFALLAWQTIHHLPGNLPSATGAAHPVILGQITYAGQVFHA
jgi:anhydro-N-acetylmuramic acid kinase